MGKFRILTIGGRRFVRLLHEQKVRGRKYLIRRQVAYSGSLLDGVHVIKTPTAHLERRADHALSKLQ